MSLLNQFLSMADLALLVAVLLTLMTDRFVPDMRKRKIIVAVLLVLCMLVPLNGLTVAQWLRSVVGDLSVLMLLMLSNILGQRLFNFSLIQPSSRQALLLGIALTGMVFYPLALGLATFDPYQMGYAPLWLSVLLAVVSMVSWFRGQRDLAVIVLLPLLAFNLQLLESGNLWDYLFDPLLLIYAIVQSGVYMQGYWQRKNFKVS